MAIDVAKSSIDIDGVTYNVDHCKGDQMERILVWGTSGSLVEKLTGDIIINHTKETIVANNHIGEEKVTESFDYWEFMSDEDRTENISKWIVAIG